MLATAELISQHLYGDLVKRLDFLLLAFKYLFWNGIKTTYGSFSSLLNTSSTFAPQGKRQSHSRNLS